MLSVTSKINYAKNIVAGNLVSSDCRLKVYIYVILFSIIIFNIPVFPLSQQLPDSLSKKITTGNIEDKIKAYAEAMEYYNKVMPEKAIEYGAQAMKLAKEKGYKKGEGDVFFYLGVVYYTQNNFAKALDNYQLSLKIKNEMNDKTGIGRCYNSIGLVYNSLGEFEKALDYCLKAIKILEYENDKKSLGESYNHLGIIYYILNDIPKAIEYSLKAVSICETIDAKSTLAFSHENLVIIYLKTKEYDKALYHVQKTIDLRISSNDKAGLAGSYENLAMIYKNTKKYEEALKFYNKSIEIKKELNNLNDLASSYAGLGITYYQMKQYSKSLEYTFKALEMRKRNGEKRGIQSSLVRLSDIYTAMGDYQKALDYYKEAKAYSDSLLNEQKNKTILELQGAFQLEKRENEILLLQKENTIQRYLWIFLLITTILVTITALFIYNAYRAKQKLTDTLINNNKEITRQKEELQSLNEQLTELVATKDKFFSIIAHDLRSPFQGFLGLTEIIASEAENMPVKDLANLGKVINKDAANLFSLLKNLLDWAQMQKGSLNCNKKELLLNELIAKTVESMKTRADLKGINLINSTDKPLMVQGDEKMVSSVLSNLLSNAIKFTNREGAVEIDAEKKEDNTIEITVTDTGIGMNKSVMERLFKVGEKIGTKGTEGELSTGLGLILCKEFVEKLGGNIRVESEVKKGSKFSFTLPAA